MLYDYAAMRSILGRGFYLACNGTHRLKLPSHCQERLEDHGKIHQKFGNFPVLGKIRHVPC